MDSVGFIVTHIEQNGLLRVAPVGSVHTAASIIVTFFMAESHSIVCMYEYIYICCCLITQLCLALL